MKGIVLAGGSRTRIYPITKGLSKQWPVSLKVIDEMKEDVNSMTITHPEMKI